MACCFCFLKALTVFVTFVSLSLMLQLSNFALSLSKQIHKQAPPLEDIAEDCSLAMRSFLERALERNPALRSTASELLKDEAINPPKEDQPRCWSLDSALEEVTHTMLRQQNQHHDATQGKDLAVDFNLVPVIKRKTLSLFKHELLSLFCRIFSVL